MDRMHTIFTGIFPQFAMSFTGLLRAKSVQGIRTELTPRVVFLFRQVGDYVKLPNQDP